MKTLTKTFFVLSILFIGTITTKGQNNTNVRLADSIFKSIPKSIDLNQIPKKKSPTNTSSIFIITPNGFSNTQNPQRPFIVFELNGYNAEEIKSLTMSKLATMFNSPKDALNTISDNIISIKGYATKVFKEDKYDCDILFNLTIEFKDGKIRYNYPNIEEVLIDSGFMGMFHIDKSKIFNVLSKSTNKNKVENYFNSLILELNKAVTESDNW